MKWLRYLLIGTVSLFLMISSNGCSGKNVQQEPSDISEGVWYERTAQDTPLPLAYTDVVVNISTTPTFEKDYPGMLAECTQSAVDRLKRAGDFQQVRSYGAEGPFEKNTLLVKGHIPEMRIASSGARIWGGALAGASYINMDVQLIDANTGEVLREKSLSSAANPYAAAWSWGATDRSIDDDMGRILADYIRAVVP